MDSPRLLDDKAVVRAWGIIERAFGRRRREALPCHGQMPNALHRSLSSAVARANAPGRIAASSSGSKCRVKPGKMFLSIFDGRSGRSKEMSGA